MGAFIPLPGAAIITRKDRLCNLYESKQPLHIPMHIPMGVKEDFCLLQPRTRCLVLHSYGRQSSRIFVLADGNIGWLNHFDIGHVEE